MEFQINYLAFMAAVQIWLHCCLVYTLQDSSISKAHLYTLYASTRIVCPQQMTTSINIIVIKHLCVQEDILHKTHTHTHTHTTHTPHAHTTPHTHKPHTPNTHHTHTPHTTQTTHTCTPHTRTPHTTHHTHTHTHTHIWTWLVQGSCSVFAISVASCYKSSILNFRYLPTNCIHMLIYG
jgi:hypothetical protein